MSGAERLKRPGRYDVHRLGDCPLLGDTSDPQAAFESVWAHLPPFEEDNSFVPLPEQGAFLKGQRIRPRIHQETLRQARRLVREVDMLQRVGATGVPVPELLSYGTHKRFGAHVRTFLVQRLIPDSTDLRQLLRTSESGDAVRVSVLPVVAAAIRAMHARNVYHRDLTARNVLLRDPETDPSVTFIDCPRAEVRDQPSESRRRSDLYRLARNVRRYGVEDDELLTLLDDAGAAHPERYLTMVHRFESEGGGRSWRIRLWLSTGRTD